MPAASILPVSIRNGKLYFLFGKENPMEDSAHGFSDFGGAKEAGQSFYETALREASEELTGFLGSKEQLRRRIKRMGGTHVIPYVSDDNGKEYRVHIIYADYDQELVEHFNNNHAFLWNKMDKKMLNDSALFEKIEIRWICESKLRSFYPQMRPFYRKIADMIIQDLPKIRAFIQKCMKKRSRTLRRLPPCAAPRYTRRRRIMLGG